MMKSSGRPSGGAAVVEGVGEPSEGGESGEAPPAARETLLEDVLLHLRWCASLD